MDYFLLFCVSFFATLYILNLIKEVLNCIPITLSFYSRLSHFSIVILK